ncbi:MAG: hypothetical protein SFU85_09905 [Candidatus Methylacidiphilales bacterium]|nr:hypothetical protein [Candidatus Methylacidiphilales bacterium]
MKLGLIAVLTGAAMLTAAGAVTAYQELDAFSAGGFGPADRFAALQSQSYHAAPSLLGKRLVLDACVEAIGGLYGRMQAATDRQAVFEHCRSEADAIARDVPSYSYAYYVGARAAALLGDAGGFNRRILFSQMTGPTEQWVAELRAALVEDNIGSITPEVAQRHLADLRLLVGSQRGIASISSRYIKEPAFRERITAIVETMPEADQARFVANVRYAAGAS